MEVITLFFRTIPCWDCSNKVLKLDLGVAPSAATYSAMSCGCEPLYGDIARLLDHLDKHPEHLPLIDAFPKEKTAYRKRKAWG